MSVHIHKRDGKIVNISLNGDDLSKFCQLVNTILLAFDAESLADEYENEFDILNKITDELNYDIRRYSI